MDKTKIKEALLKEEILEFTNSREDFIAFWFSKTTNNFCIELNAKIIKAVKTYNTAFKKLEELTRL